MVEGRGNPASWHREPPPGGADEAAGLCRALALTGQVLYAHDVVTGVTHWKGALAELLGEDFPQGTGPDMEGWQARIHSEDLAHVLARLQEAEAQEGPFDLEYRFCHGDGEERIFQERGGLWRREDGQLRRLGAISDITRLRRGEAERLELERRMLHAQKLESLGLLAGGIAHDFNNLLTAVLGRVQLSRELLQGDNAVRLHLDAMDRAIQKASLLTRQMLAYSGRRPCAMESLSLNEAVVEIRSLLEASISKKVCMNLDLAEELPAIECDVAQIQQVLLNLVTNAADAIGNQEGCIGLRTAFVELDEASIRAFFPDWTLRPGAYVRLEVSDTGCGMGPEVLARMFDPFFTTKSSGRGLGLSATLGILKSHGAGMRIYSEPGQGTIFRLYFRAVSETAQPDAELPAEALAPLEGTVLLVDDEEEILETSRLALNAMGFEVVLARNGQEALEAVERHGDALRLVLLDLTMPRMDGRETLDSLQAIQPTLPVILCSGFTLQDLPRATVVGVSAFLQKPYTLRELRQAAIHAMERASV